MPSLPLYSPIESRDGSLTKGAFLKNAFVERVGDAINSFRRPGLSAYSTLGTAVAGQGITNYFTTDGDERLFAALGGAVYTAGVPQLGADWIDGNGAGLSCSGTPNTIHMPAIVSYNGILFAIGGNNREGSPSSARFVVYYSTDGETWTKLIDIADGTAGYPRAGAWSACVHDGKIFIAGGNTSAGTFYEDVWYTTNGSTWTNSATDMGLSGSGAIMGLVSHSDGKMYAFQRAVSNCITYSTDGVTWTLISSTPGYNTGGAQRLANQFLSYGGYLYSIGGYTTGNQQKIYRSTDGASWSELGSNVLTMFTSGTTAVAAVVKSGAIYLWELYDGADTQNVWRSTDGGSTWTQLTSWTSADATDPDFVYSDNQQSRGSHPMLCTHGNNFYMVGGVRGSVSGFPDLNRVWKMETTPSQSMISVGAIGSGFVDWAQNFARTKLAIKTANGLWSYDIAAGSLTAVSDADYPSTTVRGIVYLNGVFYVMDPDGTIYGSDDEDLTSWSALNFINAEFEADGGVCLTKYGFYVVALGEYTTEYFFDAGNATGSALSPVQNGVLNVGCVDGDTVVSIDDTVLLVGRAKGPSQSTTGSRFVAQLEGTSYKRISSPDIDRILLADDFADVEAIGFSVAGHSYYAINLGTSALTLVYDLSQQVWTVWNRRRSSFTHTPSGVVTANGTATYTGTTSFADGDVGVVTAFSGAHTSLNGTYNMIVPASGTLCWNLGGTSYAGTSTGTGTVTGYSESDFGIVGACGYQGAQIAQDASNGKLYSVAPSVYQDDSVYMDWVARLAKLDLGSNKQKFAAYADFVSDRASGNVLMRVSDDDSQSWTKYKSKSLALNRTRFNRGGAFTRRVYEFRVTDNIPVRAQRVEYQVDEGAE